MSCGLSSDIALFQPLVMPWQKYLVCTFIFFPTGYSLTRLSYPPQTEISALRSRIISWVSKPRVWKSELFPCWLWPQDVKLALAFAGSNLHSTRLHCKGFFFLFVSACLLQKKIFCCCLFFLQILLDVCCLCDPSSCYRLARPCVAAQDPSKRTPWSTGPGTGGPSALEIKSALLTWLYKLRGRLKAL